MVTSRSWSFHLIGSCKDGGNFLCLAIGKFGGHCWWIGLCTFGFSADEKTLELDWMMMEDGNHGNDGNEIRSTSSREMEKTRCMTGKPRALEILFRPRPWCFHLHFIICWCRCQVKVGLLWNWQAINLYHVITGDGFNPTHLWSHIMSGDGLWLGLPSKMEVSVGKSSMGDFPAMGLIAGGYRG
jgi:hypothetical protein